MKWRDGEPPKDGRPYEARRQIVNAGGQLHTCWQWNVWWDGKTYVRRNQMHGGTEAVLFPTHHRPDRTITDK